MWELSLIYKQEYKVFNTYKKENMKKISKFFILIVLSVITLTSCDALLDVDSERVVFEDEHGMKSGNDTLYSIFGVLNQIQKLADSYVLLGELRGDLMEVRPNAYAYLKEINNFEISKDNPIAANKKDYYSVINNCNYIIHNIDTTVFKGGKMIMMPTYVAAKAIRAWTYMQMALNFGKVTYYEKPILTLDDALKTYDEYNMEQLAQILIKDLEPYRDISTPSFGSLNSHNVIKSFFPVRFLLGDLFMWTQQYEKAATEYRNLMLNNGLIVSSSSRNVLQVENNEFTGFYSNYNWFGLFTVTSSENITVIAASNERSLDIKIDTINRQYMLKATPIALQNWDSATYVHSPTVFRNGDTRKDASYSMMISSYQSSVLGSASFTPEDSVVLKYVTANITPTNKQVVVYRAALLYLRYAEAVNRLGKPNLAMATLKNGLNRVNMLNRRILPAHEVDSIVPAYMNFDAAMFDTNIGVRMRGCGNLNQDTTFFRIPALSTKQDSILYVEDLIVNELALETAFEGNRFHDLMRIAIRRNDEAYLADKVSAKHGDNRAAIRNKLMDRNNWYIKY